MHKLYSTNARGKKVLRKKERDVTRREPSLGKLKGGRF